MSYKQYMPNTMVSCSNNVIESEYNFGCSL